MRWSTDAAGVGCAGRPYPCKSPGSWRRPSGAYACFSDCKPIIDAFRTGLLNVLLCCLSRDLSACLAGLRDFFPGECYFFSAFLPFLDFLACRRACAACYPLSEALGCRMEPERLGSWFPACPRIACAPSRPWAALPWPVRPCWLFSASYVELDACAWPCSLRVLVFCIWG